MPLLRSASTHLDNTPKTFRFLNCWTIHESLLDVIQQNWHVDFVGGSLYVLAAKLHHLKKVLQAWSKESFGDIFRWLRSQSRSFYRLKFVLMRSLPFSIEFV